MSLVDRYIEEIGRYLPENKRKDASREIRIQVEDALCVASQAKGVLIDDALVTEVLSQYGAPQKVAASFAPVRYWISPQLFPIFRLLLLFGLGMLAVLFAVNLGVALLWTAPDWASVSQTIGHQLLLFLSAAVATLAGLTLVFAGLQQVSSRMQKPERAWDPRSLRAPMARRRVEWLLLALETGVILFILVCLHGFPQWLGISMVQNGVWLHAPILTAVFYRYLPLIDIALVGLLLQKFWLACQKPFQPAAWWFSLGVDFVLLGLLAVLLLTRDLVAIYPASLSRNGWEQGLVYGLSRVVRLFSLIFRFSLGVGFLLQAQGLVRKLRKGAPRRAETHAPDQPGRLG
jgi:hypothetical protein